MCAETVAIASLHNGDRLHNAEMRFYSFNENRSAKICTNLSALTITFFIEMRFKDRNQPISLSWLVLKPSSRSTLDVFNVCVRVLSAMRVHLEPAFLQRRDARRKQSALTNEARRCKIGTFLTCI